MDHSSYCRAIGFVVAIATTTMALPQIAVNCGTPPMQVGTINMAIAGGGVTGNFTPTPPMTLAQAAAACGEHHFNWYQIVTALAGAGPFKDAAGNVLTPPFVDPPSGGLHDNAGNILQWADQLPWYWDEGKDPPAGTAGWADGYHVDDNVNAAGTVLSYSDFRSLPMGATISFKTWLVSLNADGSFHSWHGGYSWDWSNPAGTIMTMNLQPLNANPTAAEYTNIIGAFSTKLVNVCNNVPPINGFLDISGSGTVLPNAGDDTAHGFVTTIGNSLFPAGNTVMCSNGFAVAGAMPGAAPFTNAKIVGASTGTLVGYPAASKVLCPFWDDLYAASAPNTSLYWAEIGGVLIMQWNNVEHFGNIGQGTIKFQIQVFPTAACNPPVIQFLYPDATFGPGTVAVNNAGGSATVGYVGGTNGNGAYSFNLSGAVPDNTTLTIMGFPKFTLAMSSPQGPGSLQIAICAGPPSGSYFLPATLFAGAWPFGWFFGVDISISDLGAQYNAGFPFVGPLNGAGAITIGPVPGLPSGLNLYAVALGIPTGGPVPTMNTTSIHYIVP